MMPNGELFTSAFSSSTFWTKKQPDVGSLRTVPDAHCRGKKTVSALSQEVKFMAVTYAEPVAENSLDHKARVSGANLTALGEVAKLRKVHLTTVYKMAGCGELPGFKIRSERRFDPAQIQGWMRSRMQGLEG
jgi:excisionase family DNA binding protein